MIETDLVADPVATCNRQGGNMINKIVSGVQTGADRAGVDAVIECGVEYGYGGWLPKGRMAEDGVVPAEYTAMVEMTRGGYPKRTEANVVDSDGTVVFSYGKLTGGSLLTRQLCKKHGKPFLHVELGKETHPALILSDWVMEWDIKVLNVAGSRESKHSGIHGQVVEIIKAVSEASGWAGTGP